MAKRSAVAENETTSESNEELRQVKERAERAEAELARLKADAQSRESDRDEKTSAAKRSDSELGTGLGQDGEAELRNDSMMAHLMDSLAAGKDVGHYGRLVFAMVARHFMPSDDVVGWLTRDSDFSEEQATLMLQQVEGRDYNPPKRDRILAWQAEQEFPILPNPEDPDCGNLYRNLKFPDSIYHHIGEYREQKIASGADL